MKKKKAPSSKTTYSSREDLRSRIIQVALELLKEGGRDALTTRAVADAAGVQAPTLYRFFGDKGGLIDAVADFGFTTSFHKKKEVELSEDPIEDFRKVWEQHTVFGLENPVLYALMFGEPRPGFLSPAVEKSVQLLNTLIRRIAISGKLKIPEDQAAQLIVATSSGVVLSLLALPEEKRDLILSKTACEAVLSAITDESPGAKKSGVKAAAISLKASLADAKSLSEGETLLLKELLDKISKEE